MKTLKNTLALLFMASFFSDCSKSGTTPDNTTTTPLVQQIALTYPNGRYIYNYSYDDQKRLIASNIDGTNNGTVTYNLGGLQVKNVSGIAELGTRTVDFSLENGSIQTSIFKGYDGRYYKNTSTTINATFTYDTKGRVIKINVTPLYVTPVYGRVYLYSWDDNDNLVSTTSYDPSQQSQTTDTEKYSDFDSSNVNTLSAKNYGLDIFGTAGYPGNFSPGGDGQTSGMMPMMHAGKILPSTLNSGGAIYKFTYHKNSQGYIDRFTETSMSDTTNVITTDIVYQ